ncbi:MAG: biotin/lipoyl-containing protein, partial [Burkholderiales bacterium]
MALIEVKVPQLSESVAEATLLQWHKKPGDAIERDQNLIDIETDKVVLELPAPDTGVIARVLKGDGETVVAGEVIAIIDTEAKAGAAPAVATAPAAVSAQAPAAAMATPAPAAAAGKTGVAMPSAAKILAESGVAASDVA